MGKQTRLALPHFFWQGAAAELPGRRRLLCKLPPPFSPTARGASMKTQAAGDDAWGVGENSS